MIVRYHRLHTNTVLCFMISFHNLYMRTIIIYCSARGQVPGQKMSVQKMAGDRLMGDLMLEK